MSGPRRERYPMPEFILEALERERLMERYESRPPYQRNDYIGWITRAKRQETIDKRLNQMLSELRGDCKYMGMDWRARTSPKSTAQTTPVR